MRQSLVIARSLLAIARAYMRENKDWTRGIIYSIGKRSASSGVQMEYSCRGGKFDRGLLKIHFHTCSLWIFNIHNLFIALYGCRKGGNAEVVGKYTVIPFRLFWPSWSRSVCRLCQFWPLWAMSLWQNVRPYKQEARKRTYFFVGYTLSCMHV